MGMKSIVITDPNGSAVPVFSTITTNGVYQQINVGSLAGAIASPAPSIS